MTFIDTDELTSERTDDDYDEIAEIPEVKEAVERYLELRAAYRAAVVELVRESYGRRLPRLVRINKEYLPRINQQIDVVADLVEQNA